MKNIIQGHVQELDWQSSPLPALLPSQVLRAANAHCVTMDACLAGGWTACPILPLVLYLTGVREMFVKSS